MYIFVPLSNLCAFFCLSHLLTLISFVFVTPWQLPLFLISFNQPNIVILYCLTSLIKCSMFLSDSNLSFLPLFQYFSLPYIVWPEYSRVWWTLAELTLYVTKIGNLNTQNHRSFLADYKSEEMTWNLEGIFHKRKLDLEFTWIHLNPSVTGEAYERPQPESGGVC